MSDRLISVKIAQDIATQHGLQLTQPLLDALQMAYITGLDAECMRARYKAPARKEEEGKK